MNRVLDGRGPNRQVAGQVLKLDDEFTEGSPVVGSVISSGYETMADAVHLWSDKSKNRGIPPGCACPRRIESQFLTN